MYASDGRWSNVINAGIGGQTSTQILARIQSDIIANGCTICVIVSCTMNDIGASIPTATTIANVKSMAAQLIAAGVVPVICSPTPYGRTGGTTPILTQIANVYQGVRDYAVRSGIPFVDLFGPLVDPATGTLATTYDASNGVHPNAAGYKVMGQAIQSALDSICPPRGDNLVRAANDPTDLLAGKGLFLTNTAGVGTGWSSTGTSGAVFSTVTDTGVLGNLQQIACTSTAGLALQDVQITGWSIGDLLEFSGLVTNSGGTSVPFIRFVVNGSPNPNTFPAVQPSAAVTRGRFRIAWAVPTGATTVYARFQMSAGTGTAAVGQLSVRNLTTLGITGP